MRKYDVIIDTDIGDDVDDAFALCLAMQSSELNILGVTTVYSDTSKRAKIAKRLLSLGGFENVPVYAGERCALKTKKLYGRPVDYNRTPKSFLEKYGDTEYDGDNAVEFIIKTLEEREKVVIITLGALTNIAKVFMLRPDLKSKIEFMSVMGGAFFMNFGEYNFCCDPDAAALVLESGVEIYCSNIDVTLQCVLSAEKQKYLEVTSHPCLKMLKEMRDSWGNDVLLHDPLAVINVFNKDFVSFKHIKARVETSGEYAKGYVIHMNDWNWNPPVDEYNMFVCSSVDSEGFSNECVRRLMGFSQVTQSIRCFANDNKILAK